MNQIDATSSDIGSKPIFRIETVKRFYEALDNKQLTFVRPSKWVDPLENIIFNARLIKEGKPFTHPAKKMIYAQCWTSEPDSYALWQIYTWKKVGQTIRKFLGVRLATRFSKLQQLEQSNAGTFYFGKVKYLWKKELKELTRDARFLAGLRIDKIGKSHIKTLLVKRKSYSYEDEVRIFVVPKQSTIDRKSNLCRVAFEPLKFITSIRFDPAMQLSEFRKRKKCLIEEYGFSPSQITLSTLAQSNPYKFTID